LGVGLAASSPDRYPHSVLQPYEDIKLMIDDVIIQIDSGKLQIDEFLEVKRSESA